jgi:acetoin utilization deacetylase AcuC-like enzyme
MKNSKVKVFYTEKQVNLNKNIIHTTSRSPLKPYLLMKTFQGLGFDKHFEMDGSFEPFNADDFKIAHVPSYVDGFFAGNSSVCSMNGLPWSPELADSVRYTNASLYNAMKHAYLNPDQVCLSPTSGFHHATPRGGQGFCTFAGQVIASVKLYREYGISGAFLDLDGHFGNSIEDCRSYVPELNAAVPVGFNINPRGQDAQYHANLVFHLQRLEDAVLNEQIQYVVWCHGADSHSSDDLGGQVDTKWWTKCSETFYAWVAQLDEKLAKLGRKPLPVTLSLFGGYRRDNYGSVISLHVKDTAICLNTLCDNNVRFNIDEHMKAKGYQTEEWINGMPVSILRMIEPRKYMSDAEFRHTKMSPNEVKMLEFMKANPNTVFTGIELGKHVNGWNNHSMGKWAKKLSRRGFVAKSKDGYSYKEGNTFKEGDSVKILPNLLEARQDLQMPQTFAGETIDIGLLCGKDLKFVRYDGKHKNTKNELISTCRVTGTTLTEQNISIDEFLIPVNAIAKTTIDEIYKEATERFGSTLTNLKD